MKSLKKILAVVMVLTMIVALGATAYADPGTPSITIHPNDTESVADGDITITYTYYKILTADIDTDPEVGEDGATTTDGAVAYFVTDEDQANALAGTGVFTVTEVEGADKWYVELVDGKDIDDIIDAFDDDTFLANFTELSYENEAGGDAVLPDITAGYYFIKSSLGSKMAVQTLSPVTINEKNEYVTDDKTIPAADENAEIGQEITYTLTVNVPSTATEQIVLTDTMSKGLTFKEIKSQKIDGTAATTAQAGAVSAVSAAANDATKFTITYTAAQVKALVADGEDHVITVEVTVIVNDEAAIDTDIPNTLDLKYGNNYEAVPKTVNTKTTYFDFDKVDGTNSNTKLTGAEFKLTKNTSNTAESEDGWIQLIEVEEGVTYRVATAAEIADANTETTDTITTIGATVTINGLDIDDTYFLVETKAPTGYNLLTSHIELTKTGTSFDHQDVENNKGAQLPSTGGIGTTIFYVVGGLMVAGAGVILVTRRRMSAEK